MQPRVRTLRATFLLTALQRFQLVVEISISFSVANAIVPVVHAQMKSYPWHDWAMVLRFVAGTLTGYLLWCAYVWGVQALEHSLEQKQSGAQPELACVSSDRLRRPHKMRL